MEPSDLDSDPIAQFQEWYDPSDAAVCLATADAAGVPDARIVLLKSAGPDGFVFFSNQSSAKGHQLTENPRAALVFHWPPRQVRVRGDVATVSDREADTYWASRPRGSQLGAWASAQSTSIDSRQVLESRLREVTDRFAGVDVPRPAYWSGWRIVPAEIEFWEHCDDRLHDRVLYRRPASSHAWERVRLSP